MGHEKLQLKRKKFQDEEMAELRNTGRYFLGRNVCNSFIKKFLGEFSGRGKKWIGSCSKI